MMKKSLFLMAVLAMIGTTAGAGKKVNGQPVYVQANRAFGSLGSARTSADTNQYIGCWIAWSPTYGAYAACQANDANNNFAGCSTVDPAFVQVAGTVKGDSFVEFHFDENGSACTSLSVQNYSYWAPK